MLITGRSGAGKSSLALHLMALGASLVADDRTCVRAGGERLQASAPETLRGLIEARGTGLLKAAPVEAEVILVVDLDRRESERLPPLRKTVIQSCEIDLILGRENPSLAYHVMQYLRGGRAG